MSKHHSKDLGFSFVARFKFHQLNWVVCLEVSLFTYSQQEVLLLSHNPNFAQFEASVTHQNTYGSEIIGETKGCHL